MVRKYESTFIVNAALEDQEIEQIEQKITDYLKNANAEILEVNKWGRKRLAYPIQKKHNGNYTHIIFNAEPSVIPDFERFLVLDDSVLRHLTLQLSDKLVDYRRNREIRRQEEAAAAENEKDS
ncbi:MAG: 30S ribosomal protein S6 [Candidatus Kapaibacteriales bacterium]